VTPIEKVVTLLTKLSAQIAAEGKVEAADYDKYSCFCKEQADEKLYAIETSKSKIDVMKAKAGKLNTEIGALNQDITDLGTDIGTYEKDIKTETDKRAADLADYQKKAKDLTDAVSACERAIEAMKESKAEIADGDGKVDLMQLAGSSPLLLAALTVKQAPAKFEYSSNEIVATLEGLLAKFKMNKATLDEDEMNAKSASQLKTQDMNTQKTFAEKDKMEKEERSESLSETKADTEEEKSSETKAMNADEEFMKVLTSECETKAADFDQRSNMRTSEITAISTALEDLKKNAMGNYEANSKLSDLQKKQVVVKGKAALSFLQLRSPKKAALLAEASSVKHMAGTQRVLDLLLQKADESNSPVLSSLSMKLTLLQQSGIDHFVKVRQVIKDLLAKLDADAKSEATTKTYCDKNLKKQTETRDSAKLTIEEKSAGITTSKAELGETVEAIAELEAGIAKNKKALMESMELRADAKAANDVTIAKAQEGKKSIDFALSVLQKFYADAKDALIQKENYTPPNSSRDGKTVGDMAPKVFSGKYHGNQDASKGIIGILEVIQADFARTEDMTKKDDADSEKAFQEFKTTTDEDTAAKDKEFKAKEKRKADLKDKITTLTDDKKAAEANLLSAETTLEDLKKMCIDGEETYAERVAKRNEEIEALKEAMTILESMS